MKQKEEIKQGINLHLINTHKFKTNIVSIFLTTPLDRKTITLNSLLTAVLKSGTSTMQTQEEISKQLENMYGAEFDCGVEKTGDNQILKFYIESINDNYLPKQEKLLEETIEKLLEIVFDPLVIENGFKEEYITLEKQSIKQIIENKKDNKAKYSLQRCIEEMYKDTPYSLYKYGYIEDLEKITKENLYEHYKTLINQCKIDIFISGNIEEKSIIEKIKNNKYINKLQERTPIYIKPDEKLQKEKTNTKEIEEKMEITQGKLVIGLDILEKIENSKYTALIYNAILRRHSKFKTISKCKRKSKSSIYSKLKLYKAKKQYIYTMWYRNRKLFKNCRNNKTAIRRLKKRKL